ncbi:MAG: sulfite exporter TauE/SafE family protein [Pseudomonadota bacterium]
MIEAFLPDAVSLYSALALVAASFFTSGLTAAAGVGGGLMMLALMSYLIPIAVIIPVHGLVQLGSNASRTYIQREHVSWPTVLYFALGGIFGAGLGILFVSEISETLFQLLMGIFIGTIVWIKIPALKNAGKGLLATCGLVTTFISMFAGATGPLVAVFLNNLFDKHRQMVATHGAMMTIQHSVKIVAFGFAGFVFWEWLPLIGAIILMGIVGTKVGTFMMDYVPEKALKLTFKIVITAIAIDLIRRGIFS